MHKLDKIPEYNAVFLDPNAVQLISQDYISFKRGFSAPDHSPIKNRWRDENFERLCNEIKCLEFPKTTDILFYLFDFSGDVREEIAKMIIKTKKNTLEDNKNHNFSLVRDDNVIGLTYWSSKGNDLDELKILYLNIVI